MGDFVPIDRNIVNHWIYKDAEYFKVWFEMMHRARFAYEPKVDYEKGQIYTINRGEFMFGRPSWSERLGISEQRMKTLIKKLIQEDMISLANRYRYFSIYRINNFEKYRDFNQLSNQQKTLEQQVFEDDANQQNNLLATSCQPAANLLATTKEYSKHSSNKVKKESIKTYTPEFDEFWNVYPRKLGKVESFKTWSKVIKHGESPELIIKCATNYATDCENKKTEQQFIKHPKTFLNDERYKDYTLIAVGGGNSGKYQAGYAGVSEASRKAASRGAENFIGSPGRESGLTTEEVQRIASNFD